METTGQRLKRLREEKGLKQDDIKKLFNKKWRSAISSWENNVNSPGLDDLKGLARLYEVSTDYIACLTDHRKGYIVPQKVLKKHLEEFMKENDLQIMYEGEFNEEETIQKTIEKLESLGYKIIRENGT